MRIKTIINDLGKSDKAVYEKISKMLSLKEQIALKIVRTGTDRVNFKILEMLPSNIDAIMKKVNMTKVPVNVRVNELERVGLVDRFKGTGRVELTDFGKSFMLTIREYEGEVRKYVYNILNKQLD